jgi:hypothetical protein
MREDKRDEDDCHFRIFSDPIEDFCFLFRVHRAVDCRMNTSVPGSWRGVGMGRRTANEFVPCVNEERLNHIQHTRKLPLLISSSLLYPDRRTDLREEDSLLSLLFDLLQNLQHPRNLRRRLQLALLRHQFRFRR